MGWAHVAMIGGMALLMVYRWDTYAGGHCRAHAAALVPIEHRGPNRPGRPAARLAQPGCEQREQEARHTQNDECGAPAVALREHTPQPDAQHAAERHPNRVDPERERTTLAPEELRQ